MPTEYRELVDMKTYRMAWTLIWTIPYEDQLTRQVNPDRGLLWWLPNPGLF